jgi:pyruvate dehydrogenase E2 component (dihydrolipoamide acetyltransferase)
MAFDVIVPEVGEVGMEVVFVRWLKAEGDEVSIGDVLFEVDTEKSIMEVEAYAAGMLADLAVAEGDIIQTRQVIARILEPGDAPGASSAGAASQAATTTTDSPPPSGSTGTVSSSSAVPATSSPAASSTDGGRRGLSPRARRIARELGVDPTDIAGTGPDGLVTEADIRAAAHAPADEGSAASEPRQAPAPPDAEIVERSRRAVAALTTRSWQSVPHFYLQLEADVEEGLKLAKPTALMCAATARALARHPECNLGWEEDRPVPRDSVDLGLLVDAPVGLLITVIKDAQELDLEAMAAAVAAAAERARSGSLSAVDLGARSLTISNLGMYAIDRFAAVIPTPDVLTLAVGRTRTVPLWDDSRFAPRKVIDLTLSVDHRALDGAATARFMTTLESILGDPAAEGLA